MAKLLWVVVHILFSSLKFYLTSDCIYHTSCHSFLNGLNAKAWHTPTLQFFNFMLFIMQKYWYHRSQKYRSGSGKLWKDCTHFLDSPSKLFSINWWLKLRSRYVRVLSHIAFEVEAGSRNYGAMYNHWPGSCPKSWHAARTNFSGSKC